MEFTARCEAPCRQTEPALATDGEPGAIAINGRGRVRVHAAPASCPDELQTGTALLRPAAIPRIRAALQVVQDAPDDVKRRRHVADARLVIELHRLHGNGAIVVNADLVETVEATPDTVITLVTKRRFVVEDSVEDVIAAVLEYRARIAACIAERVPAGTAPTGHSTTTPSGIAAVVAITNEEQAA